MARAKQTGRSEARRRYRQASTVAPEGEIETSETAARPNAATAKAPARPNDRPNPAPAGRPGFMSAVRGAYHPAHIREDLRALPKLLTHWSILVSLLMVLGAGAAILILPNYTGTVFAYQLIVLPGSALAPQLVAGFFAPRASYLFGLIVGLEQGVVYLVIGSVLAARAGESLPTDIGVIAVQGFLVPAISGMLFSAAAAWYRRFLSLSSPKRAAPAKGTPQKRAARR